MRLIVPLIRKCSLLFLAFAVFGFGLQARLAQYRPFPPNPSAAKLSTERKSAHASKALETLDEEPDVQARVLYSCCVNCLQLTPIQSLTEAAEIGLSDPSRPDLNGDYSLLRPPPTLL